MDTCKKVIISGNYKDMEEKINFLTSDDGSWCVDYEDEELMDMATLEFYNFKRRDDFIDFKIIKYPKNHPEQQQEVPVYYTCGKIQGRYIKPIKIKQKIKPILVKKEIK